MAYVEVYNDKLMDLVNIGRINQQNMLYVLRLRRKIYPLCFVKRSGVVKFFSKIQLLLKLDMVLLYL